MMDLLRKVNVIMIDSIINLFGSEMVKAQIAQFCPFRDETEPYDSELIYPTDFWNTLQ